MGMQPKLRFKGFTDDWEKRKLENFTKSYSGGTPSISRSDYYGGEIPFIRSAEINSDSTDLYLTEIGLKNSSAKMVQYGDILYALYGATSGEVGIARIHGAINQAILAIKPTDGDDSQFIMQWLRKQKGHIINTYLQGGQGNLSGSIVKSLEVRTPVNKNEEFKIGSLLKKIDNLITVNQRKVDLLKRKKAGYLQKLFPKNGQNNPELRFKGYTDAWEKRRLGDVVNKVRSYSLSRDVECNKSTGYKYIHYGDIHTGVADIINKKSVLPNIKPNQYDTLSVNDLIVADASEDYQGIASPAVIQALPDENLVAGLHTIALRPQDTNATFLYYLLHTGNFKHFGYRAGTGLKVFGISWPNLSKFEFNLPSQKEQDKVVDLLRLLDNLVVVNQRKVDLLKREKKALLQKMFV